MYNFLASFTNQNGVAFPNTAGVNSSGGGATDGTEFVKIFVDDIWGFFQELLNYTDDTPNGTSEVGGSQLLSSIQKIVANTTELTTNTTHTVENFDKYSMLVLSSGCTVARLVGGTGADETNKCLVQNNNTVTVEIDFGASVDQEEIDLQPNQWIEFVYDSEATKFIPLSSNMQIIISVDDNYTISDWIPSGTKILVSCNQSGKEGLITVTLPTLADNIGKWYEVEHDSPQGLVMVDGEGAETLNFGGEQLTTCLIYSSGMGYKFKNNGTDWTMRGCNHMKKNMDNRADWSNVHIGNGVTYDNKSAAVDLTGMVITEATSSFTGVVVEDTGGTGASGILYVYELSSGFTFWTNNRQLTASDGTTCDVDETSGSSKDQDYDFYHGFGVPLIKLKLQFVISTDGTDNNSWISTGSDVTTALTNCHGIQTDAIDTNSIRKQSGILGIFHVLNTGIAEIIDTEDYYNDIILDFSC